MKKGLKWGFAIVATTVGVWQWDDVKDFFYDSSYVSDEWDFYTSPKPKYPLAETNQINRQSWGYGSIVKDITKTPPRDIEKTSIIYESRVPVNMDDPAFDAVGQIKVLKREYNRETKQYSGEAKNYFCTAQFSKIDNYKNSDGADIVLSAGHCFDNTDFKTNKTYKVVDATFINDYVDIDGNLQKIEVKLRLDTLLYMIPEQGQDVAIALLKTPMPKGIEPTLALVDYEFKRNEIVSFAGFSSDVQGLHVDIGCKIIDFSRSWIRSTCDGAPGSSGAGVIVDRGESSLRIGAISSAHDPGRTNLSYAGYITSSFLDQVPFLQKTGGSSSIVSTSQTYSCLLISTQSGLNIRSRPNADSRDIGDIATGGVVYEIGRVGVWSKISMEDGSDAYIHSGYTKSIRCPY